MRSLPKDIIPISICAKAPNWYKGLQYKQLAPSYDILMKYKQDGNIEDYTLNFYKNILGRLNPAETVFNLSRLAAGRGDLSYFPNNICLVCYEKSSDFCHRHLVSEWLRKYGYECEEWTG